MVGLDGVGVGWGGGGGCGPRRHGGGAVAGGFLLCVWVPFSLGKIALRVLPKTVLPRVVQKGSWVKMVLMGGIAGGYL